MSRGKFSSLGVVRNYEQREIVWEDVFNALGLGMEELENIKYEVENNGKEKVIDVMLDIETLGIEDDAQVFQIAASAFELGSGNIVSEFNEVLDFSTLGEKLDLELGTLKFWTSTEENSSTFNKLISNKSEMDEVSMILAAYHYLDGLAKGYEEVRLWGNGIIFDNVKVEKLFKDIGKDSPIKFYNHRDVRTIVELAAIKLDVTIDEFRDQFKEGIERHNASDDVLYQIRYVNHAYNVLTK